jgi:hypothetical protein
MHDWTEEWPTTPGWYWFWGQCFRSWKGDEWSPNLYSVVVRRCSNGLAFVTNGHFMYQEEGAEGLWLLTVLPELPE